VLTSVDI